MTRPRFRYPFDGSYPVTSPYGPRQGGFHPGVDFGLPTGVAVLAANDGQVIYAAFEDGAGNTITISGEDGWQSRYDHLREWTVTLGQTVSAGQLVGYSDNTGDSTGPHLHFEIRSSPSVTVDPLPILLADQQGDDDVTPEQMGTIGQWLKDVEGRIEAKVLGDVGQWLKDIEGRINAHTDAAVKNLHP